MKRRQLSQDALYNCRQNTSLQLITWRLWRLDSPLSLSRFSALAPWCWENVIPRRFCIFILTRLTDEAETEKVGPRASKEV